MSTSFRGFNASSVSELEPPTRPAWSVPPRLGLAAAGVALGFELDEVHAASAHPAASVADPPAAVRRNSRRVTRYCDIPNPFQSRGGGGSMSPEGPPCLRRLRSWQRVNAGDVIAPWVVMIIFL